MTLPPIPRKLVQNPKSAAEHQIKHERSSSGLITVAVAQLLYLMLMRYPP